MFYLPQWLETALLPLLLSHTHSLRSHTAVQQIAPGICRLLAEIPGIGRHSSAGASRSGVAYTISQTRGRKQGAPVPQGDCAETRVADQADQRRCWGEKHQTEFDRRLFIVRSYRAAGFVLPTATLKCNVWLRWLTGSADWHRKPAPTAALTNIFLTRAEVSRQLFQDRVISFLSFLHVSKK